MKIRIATFSIAAYDPQEDAWGVAVASKFPAVGAVVPWARAGAGAIATQSYANTTFGPRGLGLMERGASAQETLDRLLAEDEGRALRQVGAVDAQGRAATFTGDDCFDWAGGLTGEGYSVQGNILAGAQVVERMAQAFEGAGGDLPERLMAALLAGDRAGGDRRGRQSAALLVVKPEGGYSGFNDRWIDYRVDDDEDPVPRLMDLLELHRLYFEHSEPGERLPLEGETLIALQRIARGRGFEIEEEGAYDEKTRNALRAFIGNENFEDRTNFEEAWIDRPVFEYLMKKFGA